MKNLKMKLRKQVFYNSMKRNKILGNKFTKRNVKHSETTKYC